MEVKRLQIEALVHAKEIVLQQPRLCARGDKELLEKKEISSRLGMEYLCVDISRSANENTRIDLDDIYERLPMRRFISRAIEGTEAKKQLKLVFQYSKEGRSSFPGPVMRLIID